MPKSLPIDLLRIDGGTQNRIEINQDVVDDYAEIIAESNGKWPFEPVDVFHDGTAYYLADGFHRTLGAQRAKKASIPCEVHRGTAKDARIFGMTANDTHGLRMTRADKRACVCWLLDNEPKMTQAEIAKKSGVSLRGVKYIVADRKPSVLDKKVQIAPNLQGDSVAAGRDARNSEGTPGTPEGGSNPPATADSGEDDRTDSSGKTPQDKDHRPPGSGKAKPVVLQDKCPNCAGTKWTVDEFGVVSCAKCHQPHGEPTGGADEDRVGTQRSKTVKTVEALMRAFDDLNYLLAKPEHVEAVASCKFLLKTARNWK